MVTYDFSKAKRLEESLKGNMKGERIRMELLRHGTLVNAGVLSDDCFVCQNEFLVEILNGYFLLF